MKKKKASIKYETDKFEKSYLQKRLESIHKVLCGAYEGGDGLSSSTKGNEREIFARSFLSQVFPPIYRFSSGDIIDTYRKRSGQIDIIIEFVSSLSFPMYPEAPRLYLAEGVSSAIEIKSNIKDQWEEVLSTAQNLKKLRRRFAKQELLDDARKLEQFGNKNDDNRALTSAEEKKKIAELIINIPPVKIPFIAVGYSGWKKSQAIKENLKKNKEVDAIFIVDTLSFHWRNDNDTIGVANNYISMLEFLSYLQKCAEKRPSSFRGLSWNYLTMDTSDF